MTFLISIFTVSFLAGKEGKKLNLMPEFKPPPPVEMNAEIETTESLVKINGREYRQVQYGNKKYYLRFLEMTNEAFEYTCDYSSTKKMPLVQQIEGSIQVTKRARILLSMLDEQCGTKTKFSFTRVNPALGIELGANKDRNLNTKIFVLPLHSLISIQKGF